MRLMADLILNEQPDNAGPVPRILEGDLMRAAPMPTASWRADGKKAAAFHDAAPREHLSNAAPLILPKSRFLLRVGVPCIFGRQSILWSRVNHAHFRELGAPLRPSIFPVPLRQKIFFSPGRFPAQLFELSGLLIDRAFLESLFSQRSRLGCRPGAFGRSFFPPDPNSPFLCPAQVKCPRPKGVFLMLGRAIICIIFCPTQIPFPPVVFVAESLFVSPVRGSEPPSAVRCDPGTFYSFVSGRPRMALAPRAIEEENRLWSSRRPCVPPRAPYLLGRVSYCDLPRAKNSCPPPPAPKDLRFDRKIPTA